ncbi:hypothetical protein K461DRAFT_315487 [Myriangium duriaei CBS 260.36]|uniref:UvrD-like helicase ATP-binding domain-containing protein n=1 Tax=Myriangium duriaei CBS 260.36 TaxID=1168546 RepID=A0A9P4MD38_9PEZI|nr:hypothetical protein K461DRAFT_315487 [Myriangium duriaei CBS 260.36]
MAEIVGAIQDLQTLPENTHWFCPRRSPDEHDTFFFDEDVSNLTETSAEKETRKGRINEALDRKALFFKAVQILAYDSADAKEYSDRLAESLRARLIGCNICVREYHRARMQLKHDLEGEFDTEQVHAFMTVFDGVNLTRIANGLDAARLDLLDLEPSDRMITSLSEPALFALFEIMHCVPALRNEQFLSDHLDQPFRLVQQNKKITLPDATPALTAFLFSHNEGRRQWAIRGWAKFKRNITGPEFDFTVKDQLRDAMNRVQMTSLEKDFMPLFWQGINTILSRLDQDIITHHLRAMDTDICKLALDHMQVDSPCFQSLLDSLASMLRKAPSDVWDALGAISPATVVEQVFNSPNITKILQNATDDAGLTSLQQATTWIEPFTRSIRPANLGSACRALLHQNLKRIQSPAYPEVARLYARLLGMQVMAQSLTAAAAAKGAMKGTALSDLLNVLKPHMAIIMENVGRNVQSSEIRNEAFKVISLAIAADLKLLIADRDAIMRQQSVAPDCVAASSALWRTLVAAIGHEDTELAASITRGARQVVTFEPLPKRVSDKAPKDAAAWSNKFTEKFGYINELLEKLQDFEGEALGLFLDDGGDGLIALLFSGDKDTQQSAAAALRVLTSESSRRDAIRFMLDNYYRQTLSALSEAFKSIANARVFVPSIMTIKVGMDFIQTLCDTQDGILRSRNLSSEEMDATEIAWEIFWTIMQTIFDATEQWSFDGHDKAFMIEFCRDAMDFAAQTFDTYSVISGVLHANSGSDNARKNTDKRLLEHPAEAFKAIIKWLRLRDEYLVTKAVSLACKLIGRLQEVDLDLPASVSTFIKDIITDKIRNKVPSGQKAELRRALQLDDDDSQPQLSAVLARKSHKQGSLNDWFSSGVPPTTSSTQDSRKTKAGIDFAAWRTAAETRKDFRVDDDLEKASSASPTVEKLRLSGHLPPKPSQPLPRPGQQSAAQVDEFRRKRQAALEQKAKRDQAAIAAARGTANAGSGLSGIGIEGKDHSAKGQGVMVSSDESDSSDDGGLDEELFGPSTKTSKRKNTVKSDAAGAVGLKREIKPTKINRVVRSKKDMRARLQPDLTPLYKIMLGWDYFHTGDYPPKSESWQFSRVSNTFRHVQEYRDCFQSLVVLEAWQGLVKSREEESFKPYEIKIGNRSSVDSFVELSTVISSGDLREIQIAEGDIILFSTSSKPAADADVAHCLARVSGIKRKAKQLEVIYRVNPGNPLERALTPGSVVHGVKIQSIVPLEREFGVLIGLEFYDLCDQVIKAKPSPLLNYGDRQLDPLIKTYSVNKAQAKAIKSAVDNDAFTLIQGPPGSGKTKTIVAIVGALLTDVLSRSSGTTRISAPTAAQGSDAVPKKLLVCAPSNAAVDELVMRFKDGITTTQGVHKKINVVRVGRSEAVNSAVVDVTLEELINKKLGTINGGDNNAREQTQRLMMEHKKVSEAFREARDQIEKPDLKAEERSKIQDEINQLRRRKNELGNQIDAAKDNENAAGRTADLKRKQVQQSIIEDSHVICATLSGSGHQLFQELNVEFETVVVDEAAQCVEMSALIPLKYGCAKCILVGDPKQLPPTVFSKEAAKFQYEQSLFVRMQTNFPDAVHLLDTQYRMHPDISAFPSTTFYDGRLLDGDDMAGLRQRVWHQSSILAPYRFFDVEGQHESAPKGHSLVNRAEINVAVNLYKRLLEDFRAYDFTNKIGIITPYKSQLRLLKETFSNIYGASITETVEFNTTDAFQGRESEIIIFSCVRASPAGNIGFLQDIRRMNVGLTRAKCSLWVLGDSQSLVRGQFWRQLVEDARKRDLYTSGNIQSILRQSSSNFPAKLRTNKPKTPPLPAKASPTIPATTAAANGAGTKQVNGTRTITSQSKNLAMFQTGQEPPRQQSTQSVGDPRRRSDVQPEMKSGASEIKQEGKKEIKSEIERERTPSVHSDRGTTPNAKPEMKREVKAEDVKSEISSVNGRDEARSRTGTPGSVSTSERGFSASERGSMTPSGRHTGTLPPHQQQPQGQTIKRKAPASSVFMPKAKKPGARR